MSNFEPPIMTIKGAKLSFGANHLFTDVELYINRGDKICLVGRNGSGKSTLLKVIAGDIEADDGEIFIQPGTKISYMPQDPDFSAYKTLRDVVLSGLGEDEKHQEFKADILIEQLDIRDRQTPDSSSGGERKKAALAKALVGEPDILLLDEPTNHLDIMARETVEAALTAFDGTVLVVSHDRYFINEIADRIWELEDHRVCDYKGNYDFYLEEKAKRRLLQAAVPSSAPVQRKAAPEPISSTVKSSGRHKRAYSPQEAEKLLAKVELSIREQEALLGVLEGRMADPASHTDPEASAALAAEHAALQAEIEKLMLRWEELMTAAEALQE